jgi:hypothetical protein
VLLDGAYASGQLRSARTVGEHSWASCVNLRVGRHFSTQQLAFAEFPPASVNLRWGVNFRQLEPR